MPGERLLYRVRGRGSGGGVNALKCVVSIFVYSMAFVKVIGACGSILFLLKFYLSDVA